MKVKELIKKLFDLPFDADVVISGYESGYQDVDDVELIKIERDVSRYTWCGPHRESDDENAQEAVHIY